MNHHHVGAVEVGDIGADLARHRTARPIEVGIVAPHAVEEEDE
jgi:hypothetical protein